MRDDEITLTDATDRWRDASALFVDIRDPHSWRRGHIPGAVHLTDANVETFCAEATRDAPTIVYCYRGNSSLDAVAYLAERGFKDARSMAGGFAAWRDLPVEPWSSPPPRADRLVPDWPLPPYRHVPGETAHPYRHLEGHSHGEPEPTAAPLVPTAAYRSRTYLAGFDLFNAGYFWEAHVAWEALWQAHGRRGPAAELLRALIRLAAAGVKGLEGSAKGARRHGLAAAGIADELRGELGLERLLGVDLRELAAAAHALGACTPRRLEPAPPS